MPEDQFDVAIVGGGPGGATAACFLSRAGIRTLLIDKAKFPRDKSCGDAVCGRSVDILRELGLDPPPLAKPYMRPVGQIFYNLEGQGLEIPFVSGRPAHLNGHNGHNGNGSNGHMHQPLGGNGAGNGVNGANGAHAPNGASGTRAYVIPRTIFDDLLFQHAKAQPQVTALDGLDFVDVIRENGNIVGIVTTDDQRRERRFRASVVIGADGALSKVAEVLGVYDFRKRRHDHWIGAFRAYFQNIDGLSDRIEIHFLEDLMPGYLWIFPAGDGLANVGAGMVESLLVGDNGSPKIQLKKTTYALLDSHPRLRHRFAGAHEIPGSFRGWQLPCGSERRPLAGDGWMLVGDAASLIDPFSGEGIHNAMFSGKIAAQHAAIALRKGTVHAGGLAPYEAAIWRELGSELSTAHKLQKMLFHPASRWMLNTLVGRAARRPRLREALVEMMEQGELDQLSKPLTCARLLLQ